MATYSVRCEVCGTKVGYLIEMTYSESSFLADKIDYDFTPLPNFGEDTGTECLCQECADRASAQARYEEENYQEDAGESEEDIERYAQEGQTYSILQGGKLELVE